MYDGPVAINREYGVAMAAEAETKRRCEVPVSMDRLDKACNVLRESVDRLIARLSPVLSPDRPEPKSPDDGRVQQPYATELATLIHDRCSTLESLAYSLSSAAKRCEL